MNKEILKAIGEALHGEQWVTPLSKDLNINRKTIQRYMNGELKINSGIASDLASLLSQRQDRIIKLRLFVDESFAAKDARLKAIKAILEGFVMTTKSIADQLIEAGAKVWEKDAMKRIYPSNEIAFKMGFGINFNDKKTQIVL